MIKFLKGKKVLLNLIISEYFLGGLFVGNEVGNSEIVVEVLIEEIEKMKKLKNSYPDPVTKQSESGASVHQHKNCLKDDCCCGKC